MARIDHNKQTGKKKKNSLTNATKIKVKKVSKMKTNQWCVNYRKSIAPELVKNSSRGLSLKQTAMLVPEYKCLQKHGYNVAEFNYSLGYAILDNHDGSMVPYVRLRPDILQCEEVKGYIEEEPLNIINVSKSDFAEEVSEKETKLAYYGIQDNIDDSADEIINAETDPLTE